MLISYIYRELNSLVKVKNLTKRNDFILFIYFLVFKRCLHYLEYKVMHD